MQPWQPASPFEEALQRALTAGASDQVAEQVRLAELAFPVSEAAFAGREPAQWPTLTAEGRTWITAFTSAEAQQQVVGSTTMHAQVCTLVELAAGWPNPTWGLAINPGLPIQVLLEPPTVARVAAPTLLQDRAAEPAARTPLLQKLLRPVDIAALLTGGTRVSGYCHQVMDVAHIATPAVLIEAVIAEPEREYYLTAEGAANALRWPAVGLELYPTPLGGVDEASRDAVQGWLIEEPPFVGFGFAPSPAQPVREYKVAGAGLPHGAEIWELTDEGEWHRRALLDAEAGEWLLLTAAPADGAPLGGDSA